MGVESIRKLKEDALLPKKKKVYFIPKISKKKQKKDREERQARNGEDTELQKWYKRIIASEEMICWNCGADLSWLSYGQKFSCVAHVIEKVSFPSVETHPNNYMILGRWACNCHGQYDSSWENASKMPIFKEAVDRFIIMEPDISERSKIPDVFLHYIKD